MSLKVEKGSTGWYFVNDGETEKSYSVWHSYDPNADYTEWAVYDDGEMINGKLYDKILKAV